MDIAARVKEDLAFSSRYELAEVLGTGGMGVVHRAVHRQLGRPVAIKFMREELLADPALKDRFLEEARAAASVLHPNVTAVLDAGFAGELPFLVTELVPGEPLSRLLARHRFRSATALEVVRQVLEGLIAIHRLGIVHRDIKPTNLLVHEGPPVAVKILDFGLAKRQQGGGPATVSGLVLGTPAYMAPEQALQDPVSPATDLYALTVVLFELITGQTPFTAPTLMEMVHKHLHEPPPIPEVLPLPWRELLARGLAKLPAERFPSGAEYRVALERAAQVTPDGVIPGQSQRKVHWNQSVLEHMTVPGVAAPPAVTAAPIPGLAPARVPAHASVPPHPPVQVHAPAPPAPAPAAHRPDLGPLAALWDLPAPAFAKALRDHTLVQPNLRLTLKEMARLIARHADIGTPEAARGAWRALSGLAAAGPGHLLVPVKLRGRAVGVAAWLATRACTLVPVHAAPAPQPWPGAAALVAALEAGDAGAAGMHARGGIAERASQKELADALLSASVLDLADEGEGFVSLARVTGELASGAWAGAEEALVVAARAYAAARRDTAAAAAQEKWFVRQSAMFAALPRECPDPDGSLLAATEEAMREGGQLALDGLAAVARTARGWKAVYESVLLALSRLMLRSGPQSGAVCARVFAYLTAVRACTLKGDRRFQAALLAAPLMTRAYKAVASEPPSPVQRGAATLDAALDQGDPDAARTKVTEALGTVRETPALEALGRAAATNADPAGFSTRLAFALAAIPVWQESKIPGRERYLQALAVMLARAPRDLEIAAELQRAGL